MAEEEKSLLDEMMEAVREAEAEATAPETDEPSGETAGDTEGKDSESEAETSLDDYLDGLPESVKGAIAGMSPEVREAFAAREKERAEALAKAQERESELDAARTSLKAFDDVFEPFKDALEAAGVAPAEITRQLLQAKQSLDASPLEALQRIGKSYGLDLTVSDVKGKPEDEDPDEESTDPAVAKLKREIEELKGKQDRETQARAAETRKTVQAELRAFREAKDEAGQAAHPHFQNPRVQKLMVTLWESGQADGLEDAYDQAVMAVPETREAMIADKVKAEVAKVKADQEAEAKRKAKEARKTRADAGDITGSDDRRGKPAEGEPTLEDDLMAELRRQSA